MSRNIKRIVSVVLVILLVLPALPVSATASSLIDSNGIISDNIICDDEVEKKVICKATIDDAFEENSVIVVLKKDANPNLQTLTKSDFPEIQAKNVESITKDIEPLIKEA